MTARGSQVAVTGAGAVSALGHDCADLVRALEGGRSGIAPIERFDTGDFAVHLGAEVKEWPRVSAPDDASLADRLCGDFAERAAREALTHAGLDVPIQTGERCGLVFGTNLGHLGRPVHELALELGSRLGIQGPMLTVCTACSSSTGAIGLARDLLLAGHVDVVLAGGADVLTPRVFAGFHALGVLSSAPCAPFSTPFGTTLGEGAGFVVLERAEDAANRGADALVQLSGWGLAADGFHETSPHPRGRGVERAIRSALDDAGLAPSQIGYVNAHGSGTQANDPSEWTGIRRGLEGRDPLWVSSTKGALGHAQGAAGALEAIATLLMMRRGLAPPTLNFAGPRPFAPDDPVAGSSPRPLEYDHALSVSSAFGGANAAVVLSRSARRDEPVRERRPVSVLGLGVVSRFGLGVDAWARAEEGNPSGRVPPFSLRDVDPRLNPRGLDPSSRFLTAAASLALDDGGARLDHDIRGRTGVVMGSVRVSPESLKAFGESIESEGPLRASVPAFARIVLNAPAGFRTKLHDLHGPLSTLTVGRGSGLAAILLAAELVATRPEIALMLAAGVDELAPTDDGTDSSGEGAACVMLGTEAPPDRLAPRLVSWAAAGPGRVGDAVERTLAARPDVGPGVAPVFDGDQYGAPIPGAGALPSALAFVAAVEALRRGEAERAIVTSADGEGMTVAMLLEA